MKLAYNWADILKRAWSIRIMAVAFVLTSIEAILPFIDPERIVHRGLFAAASALVIPAAFVARVMAQRGITNGE